MPIGKDDWVQQFVAHTADTAIQDVGKLDVVTDGFIHYALQKLCQNTRLALLEQNVATALIADSVARVHATVLDALCKKGTHNSQGNWMPEFRRFSEIKLKLPHFPGVLDITPKAGSAISALCSATTTVVKWFSHPIDSQHHYTDLALWAPCQDSAKIGLGALSMALKPSSHAVLLLDYVGEELSSMAGASAHATRQVESVAGAHQVSGAPVLSAVLSATGAAGIGTDEDGIMAMALGTLDPPHQELNVSQAGMAATHSSNYNRSTHAFACYEPMSRGASTDFNSSYNHSSYASGAYHDAASVSSW